MADPSIRLSNTNIGATSSNVAVAITGTPANGETILIYVCTNESPPFSTPSCSGFSSVASITSGDFNRLDVLGKIASSEGTNPTYTASFSGGAEDGFSSVAVRIYQNSTGSLPTNTATAHDTSASTTFTFPALTTATAGGLDVVMVSSDGNTNSAAGNFASWSGSLVEVVDIAPGAGNEYAMLGIAEVTRATAGVQAAGTVTCDVNDKNVAIRLEIPAAGGGGGTPAPRLLGLLGVGT